MRRFAPLLLTAAALAACSQEPTNDIAAAPGQPTADAVPDAVVDRDATPPPVTTGTPQPLEHDYRAPMRLTGTEPFWGVDITADKLVLQRPDHPTLTAMNAGPTLNGEVAMWNTRDFTVRLSPGDCSDGMSSNRYPYQATVTVQGEVLKGCAAPTAEWPKGEGG